MSNYLLLYFELTETTPNGEIVYDKHVSTVAENNCGIHNLICKAMNRYFSKSSFKKSETVESLLHSLAQFSSNDLNHTRNARDASNLVVNYAYKTIGVNGIDVKTDLPQLTMEFNKISKNSICMKVCYLPLHSSDSNLLCYSFLTLNDKILAQYKQEVKLDEVDHETSHATCKKYLKKSHMNAFKKFGLHVEDTKYSSVFGVENRNCVWFSNNLDSCKLHTIGFQMTR